MKIIVIILLNWIVNALTGFYIFARAFTDKDFGYGDAAAIVFCVSVILGVVSGIILKTATFSGIVLSTLPLLGFLGLLVQGGIEKGSARQIATMVCISAMPLAFEGGSWFLTAFICKRYQK